MNQSTVCKYEFNKEFEVVSFASRSPFTKQFTWFDLSLDHWFRALSSLPYLLIILTQPLIMHDAFTFYSQPYTCSHSTWTDQPQGKPQNSLNFDQLPNKQMKFLRRAELVQRAVCLELGWTSKNEVKKRYRSTFIAIKQLYFSS